MNAFGMSIPSPLALAARCRILLQAVAASVALASCGGGSADAPPPPATVTPPVVAVPPTITLQPSSISVTAGSAASFSVAATGDAPITYQWQRNGVAITGATGTTYTIASTVLADSGASFRAVASNGAGSATSDSATLTVTMAAPVLTITMQPADVSVTAGSPASFTVGATCSNGTLAIQWQRNSGSEGAFVDIAGATAATYTLSPTAATDSGARFRARLSCSGQSAATSNSATLTVAPSGPVGVLLRYPSDVAVDASGALYIADELNYVVRKVTADGVATVIAGVVGRQSANGTDNLLHLPTSVALGPDGTVYIADICSVQTLSPTGQLVLLAGTKGPYVDGSPCYPGRNGTGAAASFSTINTIRVAPSGTVYVTESAADVRVISPAGVVTTLAGDPSKNGDLDGVGTAATFYNPDGLAMDAAGNLYVADPANNTIRKITPSGQVTHVAGRYDGSFGDTDGPVAIAKFFAPRGVAVDPSGNLYIADTQNHSIRKITPDGVVSTIAGDSRQANYDDGPCSDAHFNGPKNLTLDGAGNLFVVDASTNRIRKITLTPTCMVTTVVE